jgi:hypothetical protein
MSTLQRSPMISFDSTVQRPAREWSRGDASDIDGQIERSKRAGANESKLSEFNALTNPWPPKPWRRWHVATASLIRAKDQARAESGDWGAQAAGPPQDGFAAAEPVGFGCQPNALAVAAVCDCRNLVLGTHASRLFAWRVAKTHFLSKSHFSGLTYISNCDLLF